MKFVTCIVIFVAFYGVQSRNLIEKVQDGKEIIEGSQALLRTYDANGFWGYCAGVIVHQRFILITYQCTSWVTKTDVKAGYKHVDDNDENTPWIDNDCHSITLDGWSRYAFGLLIFIHPITGGNIAVAKVQRVGHDMVDGQIVYVPSYNTFGAKNEIKSLDLTVKKYQVINHKKCHQTYQALVNDYNFCYIDTDNSAYCEVDLGGVVYAEDGTLLGLTDFRDLAICDAEQPAVSLHFGNRELTLALRYAMDEDRQYNYNCTNPPRPNQWNKILYGIQL